MTEDTQTPCPHCKLLGADVVHNGVCPRVSMIEYFDTGHQEPRIKRIEFNSLPNDFLRS